MGDSLNGSEFTKNTNKVGIVISENKVSKRGSVASIQEESSQPRHAAMIGYGNNGSSFVGDIALFLLKVTALETARRFSKAKCPFVWRGIQALQILSYPPFKWIQRFSPFKGLIRGVEMFSRPMLALSIATAFTVEPESNNLAPDSSPEDDPSSDVRSEISVQDEVETRVSAEIPQSSGSEIPQSSGSEIWITQLYDLLEKQGVVLPERINEDELRMFYTAANGDFPCFVSSIMKTVRWRDTYRILSPEELEPWSNMVYWHGFDVKQRPCLIVRLGLACSTMPPSDRPRFAQAIISQVEHGVSELLDAETPEMTVLVDCNGLTPLRVPMQIMRTCSTLLQNHFPNRLGCLFIVQLPPVLRVIAQTFIQMLKPVTRKKLKVEGDLFLKVLSEYLDVLPSYLDGKCTCDKCLAVSGASQSRYGNGTIRADSPDDGFDGGDRMSLDTTYETDGADSDLNCDQVLRTAMISVLMIWVFIALAAGIFDLESRPFFTST